MKIIIDIDCDSLNRIHEAKGVPDMYGADIVNAINAIKSGVPTYERPKGEWIPVSERLPDDLVPVNITWINHEPEPYYKEIKGKPFTATGVYFNGQWYWWSTLCTDILAEYSHDFDDIIDKAIEIVAWQPLPEPYKKGGEEECLKLQMIN